jgi:hypothetical protein
MPRYKGGQNPKVVERDFPYIVEVAVPPTGLGKQLDVMYGWHFLRGIEVRRGRWRREGNQNFVHWCFADPVIAAAFAAEFGATSP